MNGLYLITILGNIHDVGIALLILTSTIIFVAAIGYCICYNDENGREVCMNIIKQAVYPFILSSLLTILIPTTRQLYLIYSVSSDNERETEIITKYIIEEKK